MRRILVFLIVGGLAASLTPARAGDFRRDFGLVATPSPVVDGRPVTQAAICGPHEKDHGVLGVVFELTEAEGDGAHMFLVRDAQMGMTPPPTDLDVTFYSDLGSCDPLTFRLPSPASAPFFASRGDEQGLVPEGMRYAVITMKDGLEAAFEIRLWS